MLVNAQSSPGPALWQGIMFIIIAVWVLWLFSATSVAGRSKKAVIISLSIVVVIGVMSMVAIIKYV